MSKLLWDPQRGYLPGPSRLPRQPRQWACEGSRHEAPRMYQGLDLRWYVGGEVQRKCPTCGTELGV